MKQKRAKLNIISEPEYSRRRKQKKCVVAYCRNKAGNKGKFRFCYKHHRQNQKFNNPLRYWFDVLRQNARSRGKEFNLTIEEFKVFCDKTKYLELKGKDAGDISIDRIDNTRGYSLDNIQALTLSQNSRKCWIDLKLLFGYYPTQEELEELYNNQSIMEKGEVVVEIQPIKLDNEDDLPTKFELDSEPPF